MKSHLVLTILLTYLLLTTANQCSVSIIGSGLSGVYTAWRLATANDTEYPPYEICLFDASREFGGRVLTVQDDQGELFEMGVDSFDMGKNPLFSELVDYLGLDTDCLWGESAEAEVKVETEIEKEVTVVNETAPPLRETETTVVNETAPPPPRETETTVVNETAPPREIEVNVNESAPVETGAEVEVEEVNVETARQKRGGFFGYAGQDATETEAVEIEVDADQNMTAEEVEVKTGDVKTEPETKEIKTEGESELRPEGMTAPEEKKKQCSPEAIKLMLLRSKIVNKNSSAEELPFSLTHTVDKLKDLPSLAFDTVMGEYINTEELEQIKSDPDAASRWQRISSLIDEIKKGEIKYKDVPINQLDMSMVLIDTLNLSKDDIEASIYLSDKYPRLRNLMSMNFELFAIQHLRNIAAGKEDLRTIKSFNGLSTVHDIMVSELEDRGVQIYHNAKLDNVNIVGDTILLHFAGITGVVPTNRVFLAITRKELLGLGGSDVLEQISEPARLLLGNLMPTNLVKGAVFYERAWWKDYDIGDVFLTDTNLNKLSFHTRSDCQEGAECAGWIKFEHWGEGESLNYDIFNPIDMATVLSEFYRQGDEDIEVEVEAAEFTDKEVEANTTEARNPPTEGEVEVEIERKPTNESAGKPPSEKSWEGKSEEDRFGNESSRLFELEDTFQEREARRSQFVLSLIHRRLMDLFKNVPGFDPANIQPPVSILIANWANDGRYDFGSISLPSSIKYKDAVLAMLEPIPGAAVHFVNSDFSEFTSWDHFFEGSIVMVERALNQVLGMQKPEWIMDENIYKAVVEVQ